MCADWPVLTVQEITELFANLANAQPDPTPSTHTTTRRLPQHNKTEERYR